MFIFWVLGSVVIFGAHEKVGESRNGLTSFDLDLLDDMLIRIWARWPQLVG